MIKKEVEFLISSDTDNGAINKSVRGDKFDVQYEDPLIIPNEASNITVEVADAELFFTTPNIITGENDLMKILFDDGGGGGEVTFNLVIPQGLYDLSGLNNAISRELLSAGTEPDLITLSADNATQKVQLTHNFTLTKTDFTIVQSFRDILGFNSQILGPNVSAPTIFLADNVAQFNQINFYLIHGDITDRGLRLNSNYSQILAKVLIDVAAGQQITFQPFNPSITSANNLKGTKRTLFRYSITDDKNRSIDMAGDNWSARIVIKYDIPMKIKIKQQ